MIGTRGKPLVLVVDDEEWMRDACGLILEKEGCEVLTAADGKEGLELAAARRPDIVLIDVRMPGISGLEFLREVKRIDPDAVAVMITGYATIEVAVDAMKAGAYEFLPKPFEPNDLRDAVRRGMEQSRLARQMQAKDLGASGELHVAVLAHQLKSPLASLRQCIEVVLRGYTGEVAEKARAMIEVTARRADEMLQLINDWMTLSRIERGDALGELERVDLVGLIDEVVGRIRQCADIEGKTVELESNGRPATVEADAGALAELFCNLLTNALRYSPEGSRVDVKIAVGPDEVTTSVIDDGPGISPEEQERIFEPFYRGRAQRSIPGNGLGLPIARKIAAAHHGELRLVSEIGKGCAFHLRLPVVVDEGARGEG
ncbi:MAG: hybrid sensor histidine kinase/response regulator [Deltaproteobacteria bacterium]|nr:hybrid sensor histidine kinase/response regulator [Deltaproteobacteria bacterium]